MNAVRVCITEIQSVSCVLFTFCIMSLIFIGQNNGLICSPAVMYSVCKLGISGTFRSEPVHALLAIISSEPTQQRMRKKLAQCRVLFVADRMFTRHTLGVQPSVPNCQWSSLTATTCDGFQLISSCPVPAVG